MLLLCIGLIVSNPSLYMQATLDGILLWGTIVLPSLLPFFFMTKLLVELNAMPYICRVFSKPMHKLFHCPSISSYVLCMSIISGYPLGAKLTSELYEKNLIDNGQAYRITSFCSTSGPMFVIGSVGAGMLISPTAGLIIFVAHILGAIFNGILYRGYRYNTASSNLTVKTQDLCTNNTINDSMYNTLTSIMMIGGFIAIASLMITLLDNYNVLYLAKRALSILPIDNNTVEGIVNGLIEVTCGCKELCTSTLSSKFLIPIITFIISFGGISVHLQSLIFLKKCNIKYRIFVLQKLTHAIVSFLLSFSICLIIY